jgi:hypothetical protein
MKRSFFAKARAQKIQNRLAEIDKSLIHFEGRIGGELFGPVAPGARREFFCLDEHTWVWHEEWIDEPSGKRLALTTRYDVRANGVLKSQGGKSYQKLKGQEALNFYNAVLSYGQRVVTEYDRMLTATV